MERCWCGFLVLDFRTVLTSSPASTNTNTDNQYPTP